MWAVRQGPTAGTVPPGLGIPASALGPESGTQTGAHAGLGHHSCEEETDAQRGALPAGLVPEPGLSEAGLQPALGLGLPPSVGLVNNLKKTLQDPADSFNLCFGHL